MAEFIKSNIKKYYLTSVLYGFNLTAPIIVLYYLSFGLNYLQVATTESVYLLSILLFDIPAGAIADRFGRRNTIVLAALIIPFGTLITALGSTFGAFLVACVVWGLSMALFSGAETALVYDSLREAEDEVRYVDVSGKSAALMYLAMAVASPIGSYLFSINHRLPVFIDAGIVAFVFLIYLSMREPKISQEEKEDNYWHSLKNGIKEFTKNPLVRWYIAFTVLITTIISAFSSTFSQPVIIAHSISVANIGYIFAVAFLIQAIVSFNAKRIKEKLGDNWALIIMYLSIGFTMILFGLSNMVIFLFAYIMFVSVKGFHFPILEGYIQHSINTSSRATVLSVQSFLSSLIGAILLPLVGWLADQTTLGYSMVSMGLIVLIFGTWLFLLKPKAE